MLQWQCAFAEHAILSVSLISSFQTMCISAAVNGSEVECMNACPVPVPRVTELDPSRCPNQYWESHPWMAGDVSGIMISELGLNRSVSSGFGKQMAGTPMVIMWPNSDGTVTLSQRKAPYETQPTLDSNPPRVATLSKSLTSVRLCCLSSISHLTGLRSRPQALPPALVLRFRYVHYHWGLLA